jgi:hypothetical protein
MIFIIVYNDIHHYKHKFIIIILYSKWRSNMFANPDFINTHESQIKSWTRIGIISGFLACAIYPVMILVSLPRIPQLILGGSFGPFLAMASVALSHIVLADHYRPTLQLAAIFNVLAGALVTAMIIVQLAINYSTAPALDEQMAPLFKHRIWDIVLGLDVAFDVFIGLGTLFFAINMISDSRFGKIIGWWGVLTAIVLLGANFYYFPDPPYVHGFPHIGIFTGAWYLGVTIMLVRSIPKKLQPTPSS